MAGSDDIAVFDDNCAERAAVTVFNTGFSFGNSKLHEMRIIHRFIITCYDCVAVEIVEDFANAGEISFDIVVICGIFFAPDFGE